MGAELRVAEYVPGTVIWGKRLCKWGLLGGMAATALLFGAELSAVRALRDRCRQVEERAVRYGELVEEGDISCGEGDLRLGERCYLSALQINSVKPEPYLKLAQIYREYRRYHLALRILEEYRGGDEEVAAEAEALREEIALLEVSIFQRMER